MIKGIILIAGLICVAFLSIRYLEYSTLYIPFHDVITTPEIIGLDFEDVYFKTEDNVALNGWFIKSPGAKATLVFSHGNGGNISHRLEKTAFFHRLGLNVFLFDYRGYGKSKGRPSEEGLYRDARAAFDYVARRPDVDKRKIISYGESLGGAAAIDLATHRAVACVIADSTLSTAQDVGKLLYPFIPAFLFASKFDSLTKVRTITAPKLFIHSEGDEIIPFRFGQALFNAAAEPKEFLPIRGSHNTGFIECRESIEKTVLPYLKKHGLL